MEDENGGALPWLGARRCNFGGAFSVENCILHPQGIGMIGRSLAWRGSLSLVALSLVLGSIGTELKAQAAPTAPPAPAAPAAPAAPVVLPTHAQALEVGRAVAVAAFAGQLEDLFALADSSATRSPDIRARLADGIGQIATQLGAERRMISEQIMKVDGRIEYWRTAEFEMVPIPLVFRVFMGVPGKWRGFTANPESQNPAGELVQP